nr:integrase arm-type DNA-binding domain-containing protein [Teredinibacter haidensis]
MFDYYRPFTKKRTSLSFGSYPEISIAEARGKRQAARELLAKDTDPKEHRDEQTLINETSHSNTLQHVASQWLEVKKSKVSANHALDTWRSLEGHIFPDLGKLPIHKITAVKAIKPIAAKGHLETVKRLCQRLNEIMVHAVNTPPIQSFWTCTVGVTAMDGPKHRLALRTCEKIGVFIAPAPNLSTQLYENSPLRTSATAPCIPPPPKSHAVTEAPINCHGGL